MAGFSGKQKKNCPKAFALERDAVRRPVRKGRAEHGGEVDTPALEPDPRQTVGGAAEHRLSTTDRVVPLLDSFCLLWNERSPVMEARGPPSPTAKRPQAKPREQCLSTGSPFSSAPFPSSVRAPRPFKGGEVVSNEKDGRRGGWKRKDAVPGRRTHVPFDHSWHLRGSTAY